MFFLRLHYFRFEVHQKEVLGVAIVDAVLDSNSTGNLIGFNITNGGSGYKLDNLELLVTQTRRVVRTGTPAQITTRWRETVGDQNWVTEEEIAIYLREQEYEQQQRALALDQNFSSNSFIGSFFFDTVSRGSFHTENIVRANLNRCCQLIGCICFGKRGYYSTSFMLFY